MEKRWQLKEQLERNSTLRSLIVVNYNLTFIQKLHKVQLLPQNTFIRFKGPILDKIHNVS